MRIGLLMFRFRPTLGIRRKSMHVYASVITSFWSAVGVRCEESRTCALRFFV